MIQVGMTLLVIVIGILIWAAIIGKAGYSRWWSLLIIVVGPIVPLVLALSRWPVHRELSRLRVFAGSASKEDAYEVLDQASRLKKKGNIEQAKVYCVKVAELFKGADAGKDAQCMIEELQK